MTRHHLVNVAKCTQVFTEVNNMRQLIPFRKKDNGGRRKLVDRRRYTYSSYFPERRATRFRRSESDRRGKAVSEARVIEKRAALHALVDGKARQ
ncbi:MAG: hypothetical protein VR64_10525 [Desulfatitalea sp. BRH_c12]|nr:MAG: hypothetical protein VR64_10525 [Desulfatitalea sp. BRH_c12]